MERCWRRGRCRRVEIGSDVEPHERILLPFDMAYQRFDNLHQRQIAGVDVTFAVCLLKILKQWL